MYIRSVNLNYAGSTSSIGSARCVLFLCRTLHPTVADDQLRKVFKCQGKLADAQICRDAESGQSLGYAYVTYFHEEDGQFFRLIHVHYSFYFLACCQDLNNFNLIRSPGTTKSLATFPYKMCLTKPFGHTITPRWKFRVCSQF